jgi:YVTN family beta-propeller protein
MILRVLFKPKEILGTALCFLVFILVASCILFGCKEKYVTPVQQPVKLGKGLLIACEGNFQWGIGDIYHYDTAIKAITGPLFEIANGYPAGNVVQSITTAGKRGFIVVNNSKKVECIDLSTFKSAYTLTGMESPRYALLHTNKLYVTDLYSGYVTVWDTNTRKVVAKISTGGWSEKMAIDLDASRPTLYVAVSRTGVLNTGIFNEKLLYHNLTTGINYDSIHIGLGLRELVILSNKVLACAVEKNTVDATPALVFINPESKEVLRQYTFPDQISSPSRLTLSDDGKVIGVIIDGNRINLYSAEDYTLYKSIPSQIQNLTTLAISGTLAKGYSIYTASAGSYTEKGVFYSINLTPSGVLSPFIQPSITKLGVIPGECIPY